MVDECWTLRMRQPVNIHATGSHGQGMPRRCSRSGRTHCNPNWGEIHKALPAALLSWSDVGLRWTSYAVASHAGLRTAELWPSSSRETVHGFDIEFFDLPVFGRFIFTWSGISWTLVTFTNSCTHLMSDKFLSLFISINYFSIISLDLGPCHSISSNLVHEVLTSAVFSCSKRLTPRFSCCQWRLALPEPPNRLPLRSGPLPRSRQELHEHHLKVGLWLHTADGWHWQMPCMIMKYHE